MNWTLSLSSGGDEPGDTYSLFSLFSVHTELKTVLEVGGDKFEGIITFPRTFREE